MGSDVEGVGSSFDRHRDNESPVHIVQISKPFYLGVYEVMQKEYVAVMGENPVPDYRNERGPDLPAGYIRFKDAEEFCRRLSEKEDKKYRCRPKLNGNTPAGRARRRCSPSVIRSPSIRPT